MGGEHLIIINCYLEESEILEAHLFFSPIAVNRLTELLLSNRHTLVEAILLHSRLPTCGNLMRIFICKTSHTGAPHLAAWFEYMHCFYEVLVAHAQNSIYQALILPRKEARTARI